MVFICRYTERATSLQEECERYKSALEASPVANLQEEVRISKASLEAMRCEQKQANSTIDQLQADNTLLHVEKVSLLTKLESLAKDQADMNRLLGSSCEQRSLQVGLVLEEEQHQKQAVEVEALSNENRELIKQTRILEAEVAALKVTTSDPADQQTVKITELEQEINRLELVHDEDMEDLESRLTDKHIIDERKLR